jgi:glyoxylase-like metal-dependent hydrolase (beta-lactamase superfamily II)
MLLERVQHPHWLSNSWIAADREGGSAVVIDTGGPLEPILDRIGLHRLRVTHILNTHHHGDHTAENAALRKATGARVCAHRLDAPGIAGVDEMLEDRQVFRSGDLEIQVLHIPGHTAGQAAYLIDGEVCCTGDTLFRGSVGSTTAPGHTTFADLKRSLVERLMTLPDATRLAPGHAEPSSVGEERIRNPFLRVMLGTAEEGIENARYAGRDVTLVVWGRDYDAGYKAWVRYSDGEEATVPGSRVERRTGS